MSYGTSREHIQRPHDDGGGMSGSITKDAQAIDRIADLAAKAERAKFNVSQINDHFVVPQPDGSVKCTPLPREPVNDRVYRAETLDGFLSSIAVLSKEHGVREARAAGESPSGPALFLAANQLVFVFDEASRRDSITFTLERTPAWQLLIAGIKGDQASFCRALQLHFHDRIKPTTFLPMVKAVKFRTEEQSSQAVAVSRNSVDQSVLRELSGMKEGEVPDFVTLTTPVYANAIPDFEPTVTTMFVVDFERKSFSLTALPSSLHAAAEEAMRRVARLVRDAGLPEHIRIVEGVAPNL